jgi:hypothetical protein
MKKKDIFISLAIIGAAALTLWVCLRTKGHVRIDAGGADAELQMQNGWFARATITSGVESPEVGARVYNARRLSISSKRNGQTWRIECLGPWGNLSRIKVKNNETTDLRLGPPFLIKPRISRSGSVLAIDYAIVGRAGELYQSFATKDGGAMSGAKVNIVDEAGNVLEAGQFSYG